MKRRLICTLLLLLALLLPAGALADLDVIDNYYVTVDMRPDATADITYQVEWRVLDDTKEGPLEWVKIGIANRHADSLKKLTDNISSLRVTGSGSESYVRVDLDRRYYKDEVITFAFTIHQERLYTVDDDMLNIRFGPGWFDDLRVNNFILRWNEENVAEVSNNPNHLDGYYYYWQGALNKGEKGVVTIKYPVSAFPNADLTQTAQDEGDSEAIIFSVLAIIIALAIIISLLCNGNYRGGFHGGGGRPIIVHTGRSCASSCACVSSCACACACAGGGRAGCSAKNLYGAKISEASMKKALDAQEKGAQ